MTGLKTTRKKAFFLNNKSLPTVGNLSQFLPRLYTLENLINTLLNVHS
jgi:hypothetical protein